jgi:Rrf2 family protein
MISTTGEYALRAMVALAQAHPNPRTAAQLAEVTKVPAGYIAKILQQLARRGLIGSRRGLGGGFTIETSPDQINLLTILEAVDAAPERITRCPLGLVGHTELCPVHRLLDEAIRNTQSALSTANLGELSRSTDGNLPLCD